ncbi:MAG: translesion DNA synthesis-associated protein ImuA [Gammaproteobacteria bacterium]
MQGLDELLDSGRVWRGGQTLPLAGVVATGHATLDERLPGGGWPGNALIEILSEVRGSGELGLLMPALVSLSRGQRWVVWVGAPYQPYAPALNERGVDLSRLLFVRPGENHPRDLAWVMEQALRSGTCSAVLGWMEHTDERQLRRLQLAAEEAGVCCVLFRPLRCRSQASPAALRLSVAPDLEGLRIDVLKCRGARPFSLALSNGRR